MDEFEQAACCLGERLWTILKHISAEEQKKIREIRLRPEQPVALTTAGGVRFLLPEGNLSAFITPRVIRSSGQEIQEAFRRACGYSVHSWEEETTQGFLTLEGGHRVGVAGTAVSEGGRVTALKQIGSLNFRIARNITGASGRIPEFLYRTNTPPSVLVAGEPGSGKTTFLRDLARRLSAGETGRYFRVAMVDERSELSGSRDGRAALDIGPCTDLLCGYPKGVGMALALRTLSPDILVCDEIGGEKEAEAVADSLDAGVALLCSAHAGSREQLLRRRPLRALMETGAFQWLLVLGTHETPCVIRELFNLQTGERWYEMAGNFIPAGGQHSDRVSVSVQAG